MSKAAKKIQYRLDEMTATGFHGKTDGGYEEMHPYLKKVFVGNDSIKFS